MAVGLQAKTMHCSSKLSSRYRAFQPPRGRETRFERVAGASARCSVKTIRRDGTVTYLAPIYLPLGSVGLGDGEAATKEGVGFPASQSHITRDFGSPAVKPAAVGCETDSCKKVPAVILRAGMPYGLVRIYHKAPGECDLAETEGLLDLARLAGHDAGGGWATGAEVGRPQHALGVRQ